MAKLEPLGREAVATKGWWQASKWLVLRRLSQIAILATFLLGPWAGIWIIKGNLSSSLLLDTVPMTDLLTFAQVLAARFTAVTSQAIIGAGVVLLFYLLIGGRGFCAWGCPMNIVTDAAFWLRRKLRVPAGSAPARETRYWLLGMVLLLAFVTHSLAYELINPVSMLHRGLFYGMGLGWAIILAVFLFDLLIAKRGWCSHLCPTGALYGVVGRLSLIKVRADARTGCDDCGECFIVCPEPHILPPVLKGEKTGVAPVVLSGDCTNCGRCIDICAEQVFRFGLRFTRRLTTFAPAGATNRVSEA